MSQNIFDNEEFFNGYRQLRETDTNLNILLEQPSMRQLLPDLAEKHVLDLGCGYGHNCRDFINLGAASVTGVDISEKMLAVAKAENAHPKIQYCRMDMNDIDSLKQKYDLIYSSLAFHYIKDFDGFIRKISDCASSPGTGSTSFRIKKP